MYVMRRTDIAFCFLFYFYLCNHLPKPNSPINTLKPYTLQKRILFSSEYLHSWHHLVEMEKSTPEEQREKKVNISSTNSFINIFLPRIKWFNKNLKLYQSWIIEGKQACLFCQVFGAKQNIHGIHCYTYVVFSFWITGALVYIDKWEEFKIPWTGNYTEVTFRFIMSWLSKHINLTCILCHGIFPGSWNVAISYTHSFGMMPFICMHNFER